MSEAYKKALGDLVEVSKIDSKLAQLRAELKGLESELKNQGERLRKDRLLYERAEGQYKERQESYSKEEKRIREEREKLVNRRKALSTLNNYKLQQVAEREIEQAAKQLDSMEESSIASLDEVELLKNEVKSLVAQISTLEESFEKLGQETEERIGQINLRLEELLGEKAALLTGIDRNWIIQYERIADRYPGQAIVALNGSSCSGCFMQLGPQVVVEVMRADKLVVCRSCHRILYMEEHKEE